MELITSGYSPTISEPLRHQSNHDEVMPACDYCDAYTKYKRYEVDYILKLH